jgi:hypothetical protein
MMKIVIDAGYKGYVGIEYEGRELSEGDDHGHQTLIRKNRKGNVLAFSIYSEVAIFFGEG